MRGPARQWPAAACRGGRRAQAWTRSAAASRKEIANRLAASLQAENAATRDDALHVLDAFAQAVQAQAGRQLSAAQAAVLLDQVERIRPLL